MSVLFVLVVLGLLFLCAAMVLFVWAVRSGQFEDLESEGERIFFDDEPLPPRATPNRPRKGSEHP